MSQQEDLLFCKIAIQSGLITQRDAKKGLAYAQKLEAEGKTRPRIGAVFVKANLLTQQHASRIYQAVAKRSGAKGVALREPPAARAQPARAERIRRRRKPLDPRILGIGIGSGVVLLVAVMLIFVMILNARRQARQAEMAASSQTSSAATAVSPEEARKKLLGESAKSETEKQTVPEDSETRRTFETQHRFAIGQGRSMSGDSWNMAIEYLEKFKAQQTRHYRLFADLEKEIDQEIAVIRGDMNSEVDAALKSAEEAAAAGDRDEARRKLEFIKDRVDSATKDVIDEKLAEILGQGK